MTTDALAAPAVRQAAVRSRWASRLVARAMRGRRARAAIVVVGIAVSALLVMVLLAANRSVTAGIVGYVGAPGIDLWVTPLGTDNLMRSSGLMPGSIGEELLRVRGVRTVGPMVRAFVTARLLDARGKPVHPTERGRTLLGIGYHAPRGLGGPPRIVRGRAPRGADEIAIDRTAAWNMGASVGDRVAVNEWPLRLVGLTAGTNLIATQFAFVDLPAIEQASGYGGYASFFAVGVDPRVGSEAVARRISAAVPDVSVHRRERFLANNVEEVVAGFRPIQLLVSTVGLLAAAVLVMLLVQAVVEDRKHDIAVLLALGARATSIAAGVMRQAVLLVSGGCAIGIAVTLVLQAAMDRWLPIVEIEVDVTDAIWMLALFTAITVASSLLPLVRLRRIEPVEAFRP